MCDWSVIGIGLGWYVVPGPPRTGRRTIVGVMSIGPVRPEPRIRCRGVTWDLAKPLIGIVVVRYPLRARSSGSISRSIVALESVKKKIVY